MSNPWPERNTYNDGERERTEGDIHYLIRMVQQLFVELERIEAKVDGFQMEKPPFLFDSAENRFKATES